eukprot:4334848-Pleurochrysis_carterae.AAC.1
MLRIRPSTSCNESRDTRMHVDIDTSSSGAVLKMLLILLETRCVVLLTYKQRKLRYYLDGARSLEYMEVVLAIGKVSHVYNEMFDALMTRSSKHN